MRQLQKELDERNAEDEARVKNMGGGGGGGGGELSGDAAALAEEVRLWKKKHRSLVGRSIMHRILKGQSVAALEKMREENESQKHQVRDFCLSVTWPLRGRYVAVTGPGARNTMCAKVPPF